MEEISVARLKWQVELCTFTNLVSPTTGFSSPTCTCSWLPADDSPIQQPYPDTKLVPPRHHGAKVPLELQVWMVSPATSVPVLHDCHVLTFATPMSGWSRFGCVCSSILSSALRVTSRCRTTTTTNVHCSRLIVAIYLNLDRCYRGVCTCSMSFFLKSATSLLGSVDDSAFTWTLHSHKLQRSLPIPSRASHASKIW